MLPLLWWHPAFADGADGADPPPGTPVIAVDGSPGITSVTFDVTPGSGATSHRLYVDTVNPPVTERGGPYAGGVTSIFVTGLLPDTAYWAVIVAHNDDGATSSTVITFRTDERPPPTPGAARYQGRRFFGRGIRRVR